MEPDWKNFSQKTLPCSIDASGDYNESTC